MTLSIGAKLRNFQTSQIGRSVQSTFELKPRLAGTEFLDAETGRQKSPLNLANGCRDINPRSRWPEIPAETPYFESYRKRAVNSVFSAAVNPR
jgi:hypothetical protein